MRILYCKECGKEIIFNSKCGFKWYCDECRKKLDSKREMERRHKKNPNIEIGVGSGNSYRNKHQPITQYNYQKIRKSYCELCGATTNLCVHHIDHNRNNNDLSNLITVCKKCHQQHHVKRNEKGQFISLNGEVKQCEL